MYKWKSGSWRKYSVVVFKKVKFALEKFLTLFFMARSSEEKPSEWSFLRIWARYFYKVHFVCFCREESLFWNGNLLIRIVLLTWSQVDVIFKQIFLGNNKLRFETAL